MRLAFASLSASLLASLAACGHSGGGPDAYVTVDCSTVTGVDTFVVGLEKMGTSGMLDFKLMSSMPAPPSHGFNTWVLQVNSMASGVVGAPLDGVQLEVLPYMPAHKHDSGVPVGVQPAGMPGQYTLTPVNLWMPGVWQTTINATAGTASDTAVYNFCIPS